ncbi:MAG: hypothetical protein KAR19_16020 [Bacteroidales bacterium]|nr:hypothetical protein [Bacteroidales bacterium]
MAKCVFIVQGEGRGHMSQSMALREYLEDAGHTVESVFVGCNFPKPLPEYYRESFNGNLNCFHSPYFLRTPNRKGIYVGRTLLFNLARSMIYLLEVNRIKKEINAIEPDVVFNFYDVVGALALKNIDPKIQRIGIGHHFFLHLDGYQCNKGSIWHKWFLKIHTSMIMRSCDRVLALSFREIEGDSTIEVVPPLIRKKFRSIEYHPGERYLVYLLNEGYLYDLITLSRNDPDFIADVFTDLFPEIDLPSGIRLHSLSGEKFQEKMASCRGMITTSGFDTVAEAAYLGIPLVVVPVQHHFEQRCNSHDVERSGIGITTTELVPGILHQMQAFDNKEYRKWVERAGELIIKIMEE